MKKRMREVVLVVLVVVIAVALVYSNREPDTGNEIIVTSVMYNGSDVTDQTDLAAVAEIVGGASITKNKHENTGTAQWVIEFQMDGESWTMELGVSEGDIDRTFGADTQYKIKNGDELIQKLTELLK
ncbi:MAG: hypothetical protein IJ017_07630 [Oscillospiraceae bacterium]|nr:hypothetical protein [Oscillospiraceae bacterium]